MILFKSKNLNVFTNDPHNEKTSLLPFVEVALSIHMERNDINVCKLMLIEQLLSRYYIPKYCYFCGSIKRDIVGGEMNWPMIIDTDFPLSIY